MYFRVRTTEGKRYILRYDESEDEWTLQSGFDGDELMARPSIRLITVDAGVIRQAEKAIESCEHCRPHDAEIPVDWILRDVKGSIRRECLDHVIVVGEESLRCALRSYFAYYHRARLHLSLDRDSPDSRSVQSVGEIVAIPEVGGLHHWYQRFAA